MTPNPSTIEKFKLMLDVLVENDFIDVIDEDCKTYGWYDWVDEHQDLIEKYGINYNYGATKACLSFNFDFNWVLKMPLFSLKCPYNEDYCRSEIDNYKKALDAGLEEFFAEVYELSDFGGLTIYLQEAVDCGDMVEAEVSDSLSKYVRDYTDREEYDSDDEYEEEISERAEELDDDSRIQALFGDIPELRDFIWNNQINDLHSQNWGCRTDGSLVIIDYSGF